MTSNLTISAEKISLYVADVCKSFDDIVAVILSGSCARGEETYYINYEGKEELISDYEMLIIVKSHTETRAISDALELLRKQLLQIRHSENFDLEWGYKTKKELTRLDKRFFFFETRTASKVIYGDKSILELFPDINLYNLNYSELNTVIVHRLYHVLRAVNSKAEKYKQYLIARNSLDFSTAFLPLAGVLVASYSKRMNELKQIASQYGIPEDLIKRHQDYLIMKKNYSSDLYEAYRYDDMLNDFYSDFQLLKRLQKNLQDGILFKMNWRRLLSSVYRVDFRQMKICLQWQARLTRLCEEMFHAIRNGTISCEELDSIKAQMKDLFGYC